MPQPPSRRDILGPPPRDVSDLARIARQTRSAVRQVEPGLQDGRFQTLRPTRPAPSQLVGDDSGSDSTVYEWEWDDRGVVAASGAQLFTLTYEPVDESLFVRWHPDGRGAVALTNEHFIVDGRRVYIADSGVFVPGDQFSFQYQHDPGLADDTPSIEFIGATTAQHSISSIAVHPNAQAGDLLVLASAAWTSASSSDPRLTGGVTLVGSPGALVKWGLADGTHTPMAVSVDASAFDWAATVLAVYRGVTVTDSGTAGTVTSDLTFPTIADANAALGIILGFNGPIAGSLGGGDTTGMWTTDATEDSAKTHVVIASWADLTTQDTPPGAIHLSGDPGGLIAATLKLGVS